MRRESWVMNETEAKRFKRTGGRGIMEEAAVLTCLFLFVALENIFSSWYFPQWTRTRCRAAQLHSALSRKSYLMLNPGFRIITGALTRLYSSNRWPFRSLLFTWEPFSHFCGLSFTLIPHLQREYALDSHCFPKPLLHLNNCLKCDCLNRCT